VSDTTAKIDFKLTANFFGFAVEPFSGDGHESNQPIMEDNFQPIVALSKFIFDETIWVMFWAFVTMGNCDCGASGPD
jgi:hypothetical protein